MTASKSLQEHPSINTELLKKKKVMHQFPKIELHRHLEGSFFIPTLHNIALANGLNYPKERSEFRHSVQFPKDSEPDFLKFLSKFKNDWYRSFDDVYNITYHSVKEFAKDGLFYIELRFSPEHFSLFNNFDRTKVTKTIIKAANTAAEEANLYIRYLLTFNRGKQDQFEMIHLYNTLLSSKLPDIVGIDLAGDELGYPPEKFVEFFGYVKRKGIHQITIHAGEVSDSSQIWDAIRLLSANRIGHGTSSIKDNTLQRYLTEEHIVLEQCITSNYQTGSWSDEQHHPIKKLYERKVPVTINSDDPSIQDTDLSDDYIKAVDFFSFNIEDFIALNETAIEGAFLSDTEKSDLKVRYHQHVQKFLTSVKKTHT